MTSEEGMNAMASYDASFDYIKHYFEIGALVLSRGKNGRRQISLSPVGGASKKELAQMQNNLLLQLQRDGFAPDGKKKGMKQMQEGLLAYYDSHSQEIVPDRYLVGHLAQRKLLLKDDGYRISGTVAKTNRKLWSFVERVQNAINLQRTQLGLPPILATGTLDAQSASALDSYRLAGGAKFAHAQLSMEINSNLTSYQKSVPRALGEGVVSRTVAHVNISYAFGSSSPMRNVGGKYGVDCSGFTAQEYSLMGKMDGVALLLDDLPRTGQAQYEALFYAQNVVPGSVHAFEGKKIRKGKALEISPGKNVSVLAMRKIGGGPTLLKAQEAGGEIHTYMIFQSNGKSVSAITGSPFDSPLKKRDDRLDKYTRSAMMSQSMRDGVHLAFIDSSDRPRSSSDHVGYLWRATRTIARLSQAQSSSPQAIRAALLSRPFSLSPQTEISVEGNTVSCKFEGREFSFILRNEQGFAVLDYQGWYFVNNTSQNSPDFAYDKRSDILAEPIIPGGKGWAQFCKYHVAQVPMEVRKDTDPRWVLQGQPSKTGEQESQKRATLRL